MGITVGELRVIIDAESKKARSEVQALEKRLGKFEKKAGRAAGSVTRGFDKLRVGIKKLGPAIAGLTAILGPTFLLSATRSAVAFGDNIKQTADKIGFSTDALQELRFAAEQVGIAHNTTDMALQRFSRRVGEAAKGTGEAKGALKELGVELLDVNDKFVGNEAVLTQAAKGIARLENQTDRLALAFKLFDSEGAAFVNLLGLGADGMQEMRDQAQRLGLVLESDTIERATELNQQLKIAELSMGTTLKTAMIDLAPITLELSKRFADFTQNLVFLISKFREVEGLSLNQLRARSTELSVKIADLNRNLKETADTASAMNRVRGVLGIPVGGIGTVERLNEQIAETRSELEKVDALIAKRSEKPEVGDPSGTGAVAAAAETPEQAAARRAAAKLKSEQEAGLEAAKATAIELRQERLAAIDPLLEEIDIIKELILEQQNLTVAEGVGSLQRDENIEAFTAKIAALRETLQDETAAEEKLNERLALSIAKVNELDTDRARAILVALQARKAEAVGVQETNEAVREAITGLEDLGKGRELDKVPETEQKPGDRLAASISGSVSAGALDGLMQAFDGEGVDLAESFGQVFGDIFADSMEDVIGGLADKLTEMLEGAFDGMGEGLGQALGAGIGIAGSLVARQLGGTSTQQSFSSRAQSQVTSSQAIRGVVAGPTSIPIAQVGNAIRDAGAETLAELVLQTALLGRIDGRLAVMTLGGGGGGAGLDLTASETLG